MATSQPLSGISYNTEPWFIKVCERLIEARIVEYVYYIKHSGEDGDKDHIHYWLQPARAVSAMDLKDEFREPDPKKPDKPLGSLPLRKSKVADWLQYAMHNPVYLAQHSADIDEVSKLRYDPEDIHCIGVDRIQLERDIRSSYHVLDSTQMRASRLIAQGESAVDAMIMSNANPQQILAICALLKRDFEQGAKPAILKQLTQMLEDKASDKNSVSRETSSDSDKR